MNQVPVLESISPVIVVKFLFFRVVFDVNELDKGKDSRSKSILSLDKTDDTKFLTGSYVTSLSESSNN